MSRPFRDKNKDLVNLQVVSSREVWERSARGKWRYKKGIDVYGKIERGTSAFVLNTNTRGENTRYIEDTSVLPKRVKKAVVKCLYDGNRVAYLVKKGKTK